MQGFATLSLPRPTVNQRQFRAFCARLTPVSVVFGAFCAVSALLAPSVTNAQIAKVTDDSGRRFWVNAEPINKIAPARPRNAIYMPSEKSFLGKQDRPEVTIDRDGIERMVHEAADRHNVDPALVRAVIETESNWNPSAFSRKGAVGLMQLMPTTAQRFGVRDLYTPQQNVEAGVTYLKTLLERYDGNLDLALAAYNAGEGAVDRAHGIPRFRETRDYVQKVQNAYYRPGSGRLTSGFTLRPRSIRKNEDSSGRIIFTND
jgi:soluble lytic murein transglycosylase-like protein